MDVYDPLAVEVPPPRYALESDDEDEYNPSSRQSNTSEQVHKVNVELKTTCGIPRRRPLIFVSGDAGVEWVKIVHLGEQSAAIHVNDLPVGQVFCSSNVVIIVSEAEDDHARLPLFAMPTYATTIIDHLQPTSVAILDYYSTQTYISSRVISRDTAPIRYLSFGKESLSDSGLELFSPPNLLQSTTAALLNALFLRSLREEPTGNAIAVVLLPSPKISRPPPTAFEPRRTFGDFADTNWERDTLEKAHKLLFSIVGETVDESTLRPRTESVARSTVPTATTRSTLGEIGEGSMYI